MARRDKMRSAEKIALFLEALVSNGGNISAACEDSGVTRSVVYGMEQEDPQFAQAFREAQRHGLEVLEDEARRRAFAGTSKPVFYQGVECGVVREYSDTLMIFLLKGGMPDKYAERQKTDLSSSDGTMSPVPVITARLPRQGQHGQKARRA